MKAGYGYAIVGTGTTRVGFEADVEELSDRDLDTLERQAAEIMTRVREAQDRRLGIRTTGGVVRGGPWDGARRLRGRVHPGDLLGGPTRTPRSSGVVRGS